MKIWVLAADTTYDVSGEVFSTGYMVGAYSSEEEATAEIERLGDTYDRRMDEYTIESFTIKMA